MHIHLTQDLKKIYPSSIFGSLIIRSIQNRKRDEILEELRIKFNHLNDEIEKVENTKDINRFIMAHLNMNNLRQQYKDYDIVKLYPFEPEIFIKLISSLLLPFFFIWIQLVLS